MDSILMRSNEKQSIIRFMRAIMIVRIGVKELVHYMRPILAGLAELLNGLVSNDIILVYLYEVSNLYKSFMRKIP